MATSASGLIWLRWHQMENSSFVNIDFAHTSCLYLFRRQLPLAGAQGSDHNTDLLGNIFQCLFWVRPSGDGLSACWENLELCEWRVLPIYRTEQNRNHACCPLFVHLQCLLHLHSI